MLTNRRNSLFIILIAMILLLLMPVSASANSAQPPSLVILVNNPPDDLSLIMSSEERDIEGKISQVAWEKYYLFYSIEMKSEGEYLFIVHANGNDFECVLKDDQMRYEKVYTLDIEEQAFSQGATYQFRSFLLVSIRLILTLIIEGIIFWLFQYRLKRSWVIFFLINLITQGLLNIWLNSEGPMVPYLLFFGLVFAEILIFIFEMIAFSLLLKEHKSGRGFVYAFVANLISFIAGFFIITYLPL